MRIIILLFLLPNMGFSDTQEFLNSISNHNTNLIITLLKSRNIDYQFPDGCTPLTYSVFQDDKFMTTFFLNQGANIEAREKDGDTPLQCAVYWGYKELVEYLIVKGANVNTKDNYQNTPLMNAARNGFIDIAKILMKAGSMVNVQDDLSNSALHYATKYSNSPEMIAYLLANEADYKLKNSQNQTAFKIALLDNDYEMSELFLQYEIKSNLLTESLKEKEEFVYISSKHGHMNTLSKLLQNGFNPNSIINDEPALLIAILEGNFDIVKILISNKVNINATNNYGDNPLTSAAYAKEFEIFDYLLQNGSDILHIENDGDSVLHCSVRSGAEDIVNLILLNKQMTNIINHQNKNGVTPLDIAKDGLNKDIFKLLINAGAKDSVKLATKGSFINSKMVDNYIGTIIQYVPQLLNNFQDITEDDFINE